MTTISALKNGEVVNKLAASISGIKSNGENFCFILQDCTGSIDAFCNKNLFTYENLKALSEGPVYIDGFVKPGLSGVSKKELKVKNIQKGGDDENLLKQVTEDILPDEKISFYIQTIQNYIRAVKCPGYRQLLQACFSDENLKQFKTMPATHTRQASLYGGALQQIATVTALSVSTAQIYVKYANDFYAFSDVSVVNWDLLVTGALLHLAGNLLYYDKEIPHLKTALGVNQGYASCEMSIIYHFIRNDGVILSDEELSALLGVVNQCNEFRIGVKASCIEARILSGAFQTYRDLDIFDHEIFKAVKSFGNDSQEDELQSYLYASQIECYASNNFITKKADFMKKAGKLPSEKTEEKEVS